MHPYGSDRRAPRCTRQAKFVAVGNSFTNGPRKLELQRMNRFGRRDAFKEGVIVRRTRPRVCVRVCRPSSRYWPCTIHTEHAWQNRIPNAARDVLRLINIRPKVASWLFRWLVGLPAFLSSHKADQEQLPLRGQRAKRNSRCVQPGLARCAQG